MNFDLTEDQLMLRDSFARFLDANSTSERIRAAEATGFDQRLWHDLAEQGALLIRVPEDNGGLGLGLFDAALLMEEAGRTLASGPLAESIVALRLLAQTGGESQAELLESASAGAEIVTLALHDMAIQPLQWIAGGSVARAAVARNGEDVVLLTLPDGERGEENLAQQPVAEIDLSACASTVLATGAKAIGDWQAAVEEWKVLIASALSGLGLQALKMASEYACERKQFGQFIGQFQGISHPLADCFAQVDSGKLLVWKTIRDLADNAPKAASFISAALWYNSTAVSEAVSQALQTFGGYGLTTEYDIYLYNIRAKGWPLVYGDPQLLLDEAGERLYSDMTVSVPDAGDMPIEFSIGEEAEQMMKTIDDFMTANVTDEMRAKFHYSWEGWVPELHKKLIEEKLLFLGTPELGGRDVGPYAIAAAREAFEKHGYNNPAANVAQMVGLMISRFGSDELKDEVLTKIMNGDAITSLGYSEPGSGSDVFAAQCKATPEGNGWRIDGTKMFTSGANLADYVLMLCRTNTEVAKHAGLTMFIVPLKADGVTIQPVYTFQDERTNITFYDNVYIPDSWRLGDVDGGVKTMSVGLELEHGGGFGKVMKCNFEAAEELAAQITVPGKGRLIDQAYARARLARALTHVRLSDVLESRAKWTSVKERPDRAYGPMTKMYTSELFMQDARDLLDLTAPLSLSKREGAAKLLNQSYRHAHGTRIYGGTSEVHRSMVAERGLGLPRTRGK